MESKLAPIVLFVYNRPWHTEQALEALAQNEEARESVLYIYADGPKQKIIFEEIKKIEETRRIIKLKKWCKEVYIIESEINKGLANSVITATTAIVNQYGSVITLEDDVVVSNYFLKFMNKALQLYESNQKVWMISGFYWPIKSIQKQQSFFLPFSSTQAWGTWKRAWDMFDPLAKGYEKMKISSSLKKKFNLNDCYDFAEMLFMQMETKQIDSWAVRFWWSLFQNKGLVLFPDKSLIKNIGWDGSGTHCGTENFFEDAFWDKNYQVVKFPAKLKISQKNFRLVKVFHKKISHPETVTIKNKILGFLIQIKEKWINFIIKERV